MNDKARAFIAADYADEVSGRADEERLEQRFKPKWMNITIYLLWPIAFWGAVFWWIFG